MKQHIDSSYKESRLNRQIINKETLQAQEICLKVFDIYTNKGNAHDKLQQYSEAIDSYANALEINHNNYSDDSWDFIAPSGLDSMLN